MAISVPAYNRASVLSGTSVTVDRPLALDDDDYLLCLLVKDDNAGTVSATGFTFAQFASGSGDDKTVAWGYKKITDTVSEPSTYTFNYVESEEAVANLFIIRGADLTDFFDVTYVQATHGVEVNNVWNADSPPVYLTPKPITTVTDGALVVVFGGSRSDAEIDNTFENPTGFTGMGGSAITTGWDRAGTGNGDAQYVASKLGKSTAGTVTPDEWGSTLSQFGGERDFVAVTLAIRPAGAGQPEASGTINGGGGLSATVVKNGASSGTINGGGSGTATVSHKGAATGAINGGGSIAATVATPSTTTLTELKFDTLSAPYIHDRTRLWIRHKASSSSFSNATATLDIYESTTLIAHFTSVGIATTVDTEGWLLSTAQSEAITDWSDLRIRISLTDPDADIADYLVYDVWLTAAEATGQPKASGTINGGGSFAAAVSHNGAVAEQISGGGSLTPAFAKSVERTGIVNSGGSITATVEGAHAASDELNTGGGIVPAFTKAVSRAAEINAGGSITASVATNRQAAETIAGGGSLAATVSHDGAVSAAINGGGSITASTGASVAVSGTIHGGGSITATVTGNHAAADTLNTGGGLNAAFTKAVERSETIRGGGSLTPVSVHRGTVAASINGGGSITASVTASQAGSTSGVINGGGSITATVAPTRIATGTVRSGGGLTATVTHRAVTATTLNGGGSITATVAQGGVDTYTELALEPLSDPAIDTDHSITTRLRSPLADDSLVDVTLYCDGVFIATTTAQGQATWFTTKVRALTEAEAAAITDYSLLTLRLKTNPASPGKVEVADVWLGVPYPPPLEAELNTGGGLTPAWSGHHVTRAFPDLGEGLMGPAINTGGSITASTSIGVPGEVAGTIRGGGGITAAVTGAHEAADEINAGGSITASVLVSYPGEVRAELNTGGSIHAIVIGRHVVAAVINGGGSIVVTTSNWIPMDRTTGVGETDDGASANRAIRSQDIGLTIDETQPGETGGLHSPGETA